MDLVLEQQGRYWRKRVELKSLPAGGQLVGLLDQPAVTAVVVGVSTIEGKDSAGVAADVLLRCTSLGADPSGRLHQAGWRALL